MIYQKRIILKNGVSLVGLQIQMRKVLEEATQVWNSHDKLLVITSGTEGEHSPGSMHYYGYALDLRTRYFKDLEEVTKVANELQKALGGWYDVIVEGDHIHTHYRRQ